MKILIAEDNELARHLLTDQITRQGHEVRAVTNGREAQAEIARERPQILVTDWVMPEVDGLDLSRWVRNQADGDYIYVLMLSSTHTTVDAYHQAMDAGVDDFLMRPCPPRDVEARLRVAERLWRYACENRRLQQLLPICMYCHRVRDDRDYWQELEAFLQAQGGTQLSHGICPKCYETVAKTELQSLAQKLKPNGD